MSTALPESFTFALQSRMPSNSFVVKWKEFRTDNMPRNGTSYVLQGPDAQSERVRLHLRGAPNEFLLNTNTFLCFSSYAEITQDSIAPDTEVDNVLDATGISNILAATSPITNGHQIDFFSGSRESFNSGALPNLDNQDTRRSHVFNRLRSYLARRNASTMGNGSKFDMRGCIGGQTGRLSAHDADYQFDDETLMNTGKRIFIITNSTATAGSPDNTYGMVSSGSNYKAQIPLGYYSNLINCHSVIPLGLFSAYSVNGYSIELTTVAEIANLGFCGEFLENVEYPSFSFRVGGVGRNIDWVDGRRVMSDIKVYAPVIQILDPAVMDSILSLYEKREMVNLGGVQFPLSLRLNSLGYRLSSYPLVSGVSDYHFRIAGTDRSVRGLAWYVTQNDRLVDGELDLLADPYVNQSVEYAYGIRVTRLDTRIGNEHIHEVVEDRTPHTDNVDNFLNINIRHSGSLWSPFPQYLENKRFDGQNEDTLCLYNNADVNFFYDGVNLEDERTLNLIKTSVCYGVISFENMDRREQDHPGSYQASGKDLTNVGGIEIDMRFQSTQILAIETTGGNRPTVQNKLDAIQFVPPQTNYEIHFSYVYDQIHEASPSGIMEITNAVL